MSKQTANNEWANHAFDRTIILFHFLFQVLREITLGLIQGRLPILRCCLVFLSVHIAFKYGLDYWAFKKLSLTAIYPYRIAPKLFPYYQWFWLLSGVWGWAIYQIMFKRKKQAKLDEVFLTAGLRSAAGKTPRFIHEWRVDQQSFVLRLSNAGLPKEKFEQQRSYIESALGIYVDGFEENRTKNQIDIQYSHVPMPELIDFDNDQIDSQKGHTFFIGTNRSDRFTCSLQDTPHLLVAGETSSGKSTFLRQVITTL